MLVSDFYPPVRKGVRIPTVCIVLHNKQLPQNVYHMTYYYFKIVTTML